MPKGHPESTDDRFAANLRALRERAGLSQSALADAMTGHGHAWHQQTVDRVESGRQAVRFREAVDLAAILRTSTDRFTWSSPEASATEFVYSAGSRLRQQYEITADAVCRLIADSATAERVAGAHKDSEWERVREAVRDVTARVEAYDLDAAIGEGIRRYEERFEGEGGDDAQGES
jgi:transcriptional regulator with XRE-family HTH domain